MEWLIASALLVGAAFWLGRRAAVPARDALAALELVAAGGSPKPIRGSGPLVVAARRAISSIAERLADLEARAEAESRNLRAILGSMSEAVFLIDNTQRIRLANESALAMFSIEPPALGRSLLEVFRSPELVAVVDRAIRVGQRESGDVTHEVRGASGYEKKHFHVTAAPIPSVQGKAETGVVVVIHDVTEIRRLESVRREFVANVSHEIRTPLAIINGYLETLLDGAADDPQLARSFLETMSRHGNRLHLLIEDLLTISRLESGAVRLQLAPTSLREVVNNVVQQLDPKIRAASALVKVGLPKDLPEIRADGLRLEQLFFNLLDNALKYVQSASPEISFSGRLCGEEVEVSISDNGPGIPIHDQPHIFERFYRIHKDRSRDAGGTGLGLSIVKHIALIHGGGVSLASKPGKGCTFTVRLPIAGPNAAEAPAGDPPRGVLG